MKLSELIQVTNAKVFGSYDEDVDVQISTDTRTIQKGDVYLPLKGASFDGEKFINQALDKGAIGAFCTESHPTPALPIQGGSTVFLQVPNTLIAYLQLANYRRNKLNLKVVAITGSW